MDTISIITEKRDGKCLKSEEIDWFISGVVDGSIPDYQTSALLMAIYINGMGVDEISTLTHSMIKSGEKLNLKTPLPKFDKHSTGGVGDKVSLILAPLLASSGIAVPMLSGRALGHTGGTLNKLESIPGMRVYLSKEEIEEGIESVGMVIAGQTENIAPADKKLYFLRDRTGTIESIPLITSSILSKKLSEDIDGLMLDVKVGKGAFMKTASSARMLAESMLEVGRKMGVKIGALLTAMDTPLGNCVGTGVEVYETIHILRGEEYPESLIEVTFALFESITELAGVKKVNPKEKIIDGSAYKKFREFIEYQGGDISYVDSPEKLLKDSVNDYLISDRNGFVTEMDTRRIGKITVEIEPISCGIIFHKKTGDRVKVGDLLATIFWHRNQERENIKNSILSCYKFGKKPPSGEKTILEKMI